MLTHFLRSPRRPLPSPSILSRFLSHRRAKSKSPSSSPPSKKPKPPSPPPPPPRPPPRRPEAFSLHGVRWEDPYSWMSSVHDSVAMRHMDAVMEGEERYLEGVMGPTARLRRRLQSEMSVRMATDLSSPPVRWGPWLYYRRVQEGRPHPLLCRRSAALHEEFLSLTTPSGGFDFDTGRRIEHVMLDYNLEADRFGGYPYEEQSGVSPDHHFLAYTMYDKDKDAHMLFVKDLYSDSLCNNPRADNVAHLAWAMNGKALLYTVRDNDMRPYRIYLSFVGSDKDDVLIFDESDKSVFVNIRNTKDFQFITVNNCSNTSTKVYLINAADPLSGLTLVWDCEERADCIADHHRGWIYLFTNASRDGSVPDSHYLLRRAVRNSDSNRWESVIVEEPGISIEDVDFCDSHMAIVLRKGKDYKICSIALPLPIGEGPMYLHSLQPCFLPLPENVCQICPGPNYDYYSSTMRFTISSPVMPDAVVDYDLSNGKWQIVQQQNLLLERTRTLYGTSVFKDRKNAICAHSTEACDNLWNELSEFYACEHYDVSSEDGVLVPLTVAYSRKQQLEGSPGLLHGHGACGEILDKRWRSELKSLLDRGWVVAYADVRGGGGKGRKWHLDGKRTLKENSIADYISCAEFLIKKNIVEENKLAGWGYSAGGLLVASAINARPGLFRAAVLKVPFLDPCSTLLNPVLPLDPLDYEEFGYPGNAEDFLAMRSYSPYDSIQEGVLYPAVLVIASFNTRFGIWEAAKWVTKVRELTVHDPEHPILLSVTMDMVEESKYLQSKELALEAAFLIKTVVGSWR